MPGANRTASHVTCFSDSGLTASLGTTTVTAGAFTLTNIDFSGLNKLYFQASYDDGSNVHYSADAAEILIYDASSLTPEVTVFAGNYADNSAAASQGILATAAGPELSVVCVMPMPTNGTCIPTTGDCVSQQVRFQNVAAGTAQVVTFSTQTAFTFQEVIDATPFMSALQDFYSYDAINTLNPLMMSTPIYENVVLASQVCVDDTINVIGVATRWTDGEGNHSTYVHKANITINMMTPGTPVIATPADSTIFAISTTDVTGTIPV